jgi:hypothetical protein
MPDQGHTELPTPAASRREQISARPRRLNALGRFINWQSYLEIGVQAGRTFVEVDCPRKVGVDPRFKFDISNRPPTEVFYVMTSDQYFSSPELTETFDVVFLDGLHTYQQTLADLRNALERTHANSLILIDDTLPTDPFAALPSVLEAKMWRKQYANNPDSSDWQGDVFKVVVYIHDNLPGLSYASFNSGGNPQTVVWRSPRTNVVPFTHDPSEIAHLDFFWLMNHLQVLNLAPEPAVLATVSIRLGAAQEG